MENEMTVNEKQLQYESWSPKEVMAQVQMIQSLMREGMKEGEHYGTIPGTQKPTLYKAGAEKLGLMFRLAPKFVVEEKDLGNGHKEFIVRTSLYHINSGKFYGEGVGSCSTMEAKYRYRSGDGASTGVVVPKNYWDLKRAGKFKEAQEVLGGPGYKTAKIDGTWFIVEKIERQENPDIADSYNTVLKIAKKRSLVDAHLTATAASDIFTQDLDELPEAEAVKIVNSVPIEEKYIIHDEQLEIHKQLKMKNVSPALFKKVLRDDFGAEGTAKIKKEDYSKVMEWIVKNENDAIDVIAE